MEIMIYNMTDRPYIFLMSHKEVCLKSGVCKCRNGIPASLHLPARKNVKADGSILNSSDMQRAIKDGNVKIGQVRQVEEKYTKKEKNTGRPKSAAKEE